MTRTTPIVVLGFAALVHCGDDASSGGPGAGDGGSADGASDGAPPPSYDGGTSDGGGGDGGDGGGADRPWKVDTTFGTGGLVNTGLMEVYHRVPLFVQSDGKIVVASAKRRTTSGYDPTVQRWTPQGSLDASFGTGGEAIKPVAPSFKGYDTMGRLSSGRIVLADSAGSLSALTADGQPDNGVTFTANIGGTYKVQHIVEGAAGSIFLACANVGSTPYRTFIVKLRADGSGDTSFGPQGRADVPLHLEGANANYNESPTWMRRLPDESWVVAQERYQDYMVSQVYADGGINPAFATRRSIASAGTAVTSFFAVGDPSGDLRAYGRGNHGLTAFRFPPNADAVKTSVQGSGASPIAAAELPDGRVLVAVVDDATATQLWLQRYRVDGTLDVDYAAAKVTMPSTFRRTAGLAIGPDGSAVVAATVEAFGAAPSEQTVLVRFSR